MLLKLKTQNLVPPPTQLRPVLEGSLEFLELVESIREHGLINSICVREHPYRPGIYEVIDGMWRFSAHKFLDIPEIDAILKVGVNDEQMLALQIQANSVSYDTRPIEFAEQMQTMVAIRDDIGAPMSVVELGKLVGHSSKWVSDRLQLLKLAGPIKALLREGNLTLGKAVALSKLPASHQEKFLAEHNELTNRDFELAVGSFLNTLKLDNPKKVYSQSHFRPRLQSMDNLVIELDTMENASKLILNSNAQTAIEGAKLMLEWVLNLHEGGIKKRIEKHKKKISYKETIDIIRRQRYEELEKLEP